MLSLLGQKKWLFIGSLSLVLASCLASSVRADGACCFEDGHCEFLPEWTCDYADHACSWLGQDVPCSPNPCSAVVGACCFQNGNCMMAQPWECESAGGFFFGCRLDCDPSPCPSGSGACCTYYGECAILSWEECLTRLEEGICAFGKGMTSCDPNPCPQCCIRPCCTPSGTCFATCSDVFCRLIGGTPVSSCQGEGCSDVSASPAVPGARVTVGGWGKVKAIYR